MKAYSDKDDGRIQVAFTLPHTNLSKAEEFGLLYCEKLGLTNVLITSHKIIGEFTAYIAYGNSAIEVDETELPQNGLELNHRDFAAIQQLTKEWPLIRVVGAALESDAHTVGLDAILNMKGYNGDYGLERYNCFAVTNLGAQVEVDKLVQQLKDASAHVLLISQTVSQNDIHVQHLQQLKMALDAAHLDVIVIVGGMHVTHMHARRLGFTAGFGRGTTPSMVASLIVDEISTRQGFLQ